MISYSDTAGKKRTRLIIIIIIELIALLFCVGILLVSKSKKDRDSMELADNKTESEQSTTAEPTTTEATTEEPTTEDPQVVYERAVDERAEEILNSMSMEEKIYQLFIVTPEQLTGAPIVTQAGDATKSALETQPVGGIIYFAQNIVSRDQCVEMIENTKSYAKYGLFISVDEEGGRVARVGSNSAMGTTAFPPMAEIVALEDADRTKEAYKVGNILGTELVELGFNLDYAPVADVNSNPNNMVIGDRSFSSDPQTAADMVAAAVHGFEDSGMLSCIKHFPGHGDTAADSHYGVAASYKTVEELEACEFLPFQAGVEAGVPCVMVGHISLPNVTGDSTPATLSHEIVTGMLREQLGYEGLIITDSMKMQAVSSYYSSGDASVKVIQAGIDCILMPADLNGAVQGLQTALENGELTEEDINEHVLRILKTKIRYGIIDLEDQDSTA
ncbi:MAG: beta-N-acetylhexosaminidase [Lachnospiraceae bacterium]|nr:beta-N-acetylhexosaminidase [Lachnospiraceae bacterium]